MSVLIDKNSEFFVAIAKKGVHSFVLLGVLEDSGTPLLLARVGKWCEPCVNDRQTGLHFESLNLSGSLNYMAYAIDYKAYIQFLHLMRFSRREGGVKHDEQSCYIPASQLIEGDILNEIFSEESLCFNGHPEHYLINGNLKKSKLTHQVDKKTEALLQRSHELTLDNTCKTTALDLIQYLREDAPSGENISTLFFRDLPTEISFDKGHAQQHFYVFPLPPSAFKGTKHQQPLLKKIYQRMERIIEYNPYQPCTIDKFNALKDLYLTVAKPQSCGIEASLEAIITWKQNNPCITRLRNVWFFDRFIKRTSTTEDLIDKLIIDLSEEAKAHNLEFKAI